MFINGWADLHIGLKMWAQDIGHPISRFWVRIAWRYPAVRSMSEWFLQIFYCHHNARVLADMEARFGYVLSRTTQHMSKPYYTIEAIDQAIDAYHLAGYKAAYEDAFRDIEEANAPATTPSLTPTGKSFDVVG